MAALKNSPPRRKRRYKFLVSACLAGIKCTYKGGDKLEKRVKALADKSLALPICPEVLGGLRVPRENAEIVGGIGKDVLNKEARVLTITGKDVSDNFIKGARRALRLAKKHGIKKAILRSKSPSCGLGKIYNGTFNKVLVKGDGVLVRLLKSNGMKIYTERSRYYA